MGTTRMSDDLKTGVTTADCRVHGIENLYISGSSVFPTSGYSHPTYTIVALAILGTFALMLPTSNLFGMPNMRADRFMYLPSVAIVIGLAEGCIVIGRSLASRSHRVHVMLDIY